MNTFSDPTEAIRVLGRRIVGLKKERHKYFDEWECYTHAVTLAMMESDVKTIEIDGYRLRLAAPRREHLPPSQRKALRQWYPLHLLPIGKLAPKLVVEKIVRSA